LSRISRASERPSEPKRTHIRAILATAPTQATAGAPNVIAAMPFL
jgi:hypothetical protein